MCGFKMHCRFLFLCGKDSKKGSTEGSSLQDESCNKFKGDLLLHSSSAGAFLTWVAVCVSSLIFA